jgi:hypothetical protein
VTNIDERVVKLEKNMYSLEKDNELAAKIFLRFEDQVDKIQALTEAMHILISLHDERIRVNAQIVEDLKEEMNKDIKELESRIANQGLELSTKIDMSETRILAKIAELKLDWREDKKEDKVRKETFSDKINSLFVKFESSKWFILGGIFVGGFLLGKGNLIVSFIGNLFKAI